MKAGDKLLLVLVGDAGRRQIPLHQRYGPHVQGAGIHDNPTPGPAGSATSMATSSSSSPSSSPIRHGARSPCRCCPVSTPARRTCRASIRSTGRSSAPSWNGASNCCDGSSRGCTCWSCRSGWWPTGVCRDGLPQAGDVVGDGRRQPAPQRCGPAHGAQNVAGGNPGHSREAAQPGRMTCMFSRKVQSGMVGRRNPAFRGRLGRMEQPRAGAGSVGLSHVGMRPCSWGASPRRREKRRNPPEGRGAARGRGLHGPAQRSETVTVLCSV